MSSGFDLGFKELVRSRTDLVQLVNETVSLAPRFGGREYVGLCPFHDDHNPSMRVYPERQSWRCWVCNEGGDCFSWVQRLDHVEFREGLEILAQRAHLEMPKSARRTAADEGLGKTDLFEALDWAEQQFHDHLLNNEQSADARSYLEERGFTLDTIQKFRLGYHPPDWEWLLGRARNKFSAKQLLAARLVGQRDRDQGFYDYFVDRVMFPIRDERGRVVAFGGRVLPGRAKPDAAKYWNSPESPVFSKGRLLYGLDVAREAIRRSGTAVVVEGYTDCIMVQQFGLANVIGTLGTALAETQVSGLKRFARKVVLVFDGDDPGRMAAERAIVKFLAQEVDLRIHTLPPGKDPADLLREEGAEEFRKRVDSAAPAWDYKFRAVTERFGQDTIDARDQVLHEMLELLVQAPRMPGSLRDDMYLGKLAEQLGLPEQRVRDRLKTMRGQRSRPIAAAKSNSLRVDAAEHEKPHVAFDNKNDRLECELLEIILVAPGKLTEIRARISPDDLKNKHLRTLLTLCYELDDQQCPPTLERLCVTLEDASLKNLVVMIDEQGRQKGLDRKLSETGNESADPETSSDLLEQVLHQLKWRREREFHELSRGKLAQLDDGSDRMHPDAKALLRQLSDFHQKRAGKST